MPVFRNISGTWKVVAVFRNIGGTWKAGTMWRNIGGTWKAISALFTPDGGTINKAGAAPTSATLSCAAPAVWTFALPSGMTASIASGSTANSVTFTVSGGGQGLTVNVQGVSSGVTRNFVVNLSTN